MSSVFLGETENYTGSVCTQKFAQAKEVESGTTVIGTNNCSFVYVVVNLYHPY